MSDASSAGERTTEESAASTSPESSSRRTSRDPSASSAAASSPYETTRGRRDDSQVVREARTEVTWRVDDSSVTGQVRVRCWTCGGVVTTPGYSLSTRWICAMVLATVSTCRTRGSLSQRSSVRRSRMRLLGRPPFCHAAGGLWTWMRLWQSSVQLPRQASGQCDGAAPVSTSPARHCSGQRLSVRRSVVVDQACRQPAPPTTHVRYLSTSCRWSYPSTLTTVSCRRCVDAKQVNVDLSSCRACGPSCSRRSFASATSPL